MLYHPNYFRTEICKQENDDSLCKHKIICPYRHKDDYDSTSTQYNIYQHVCVSNSSFNEQIKGITKQINYYSRLISKHKEIKENKKCSNCEAPFANEIFIENIENYVMCSHCFEATQEKTKYTRINLKN
jgi:hypothetical protein